MEDEESCSSKVMESSPTRSRLGGKKVEVFNEVVRRLQESDYEGAKLPGFEDELWLHFNRLPARCLDRNFHFPTITVIPFLLSIFLKFSLD